MRCDILAVGTELLLGQIADTNSAWLGEKLAEIGVDSVEHRHVGDNQARIVLAMREMIGQADALIVTGGLGPTQDDITRQALAEFLGEPLVRDEQTVQRIKERFAARGRQMPENNLGQADHPAGTTLLVNANGTAPGIRAKLNGKLIFCVPGVPAEVKELAANFILPELARLSGNTAVIRSRTLKTWGESESRVAEIIASHVDTQTNPTIAFLARGIEGIWVRITAKAKTEVEAIELLDETDGVLSPLLAEYIFARDQDTMESAVLDLLRSQGRTLAVAESLTGGLVQARLVGVPNASDVLCGGVVSYAENLKRDLLGVTAASVYSVEAAKQMAVGVTKLAGADVGLSLTGVAGPEAVEGYSPGTAWVGISLQGHDPIAEKLALPGSRNVVRQLATISALKFLLERLKENTA